MDALRALVREIQEDDVTGAAAELAFRFLFALFPFFIFLAALASFGAEWLGIEDPTQRIISQIGNALPSEGASVLEGQLSAVFESRNAGLLSFGAIAALWAASTGTKTMMKGMNRAYDAEEDRPFLQKQAVGLGLTLLGGLSFIAAAVVLIVGQVVGSDIAAALGLGEVWSVAVNIARIPVVILVLLDGVAFIYWATPNVDIPFRSVLPGAIAFVVTWVVFTLGFGFYVANFGAYEATYGALGGVIVLMMWLYITSLVLLAGAEVNAILRPATQDEPVRADDNVAPDSPQRAGRIGGDAQPAGAHATSEGARRDGAREGGTVAGAPAKPLSRGLGGAVAALVFLRLIRNHRTA
ncbi:MAG: YihY/virulence factor BrkB family protein [Dehalococcoidia bacterium]